MENENKQCCAINLLDRYEIIVHFRDLANIGPMLDIDLDKELCRFRKRLKDIGWSAGEICKMEEIAYSNTIYSQKLPHIQKGRGSWLEYLKVKARQK